VVKLAKAAVSDLSILEALLAPGEWLVIAMQDGRQVATRRKVISKDGKTMRQTVRSFAPDGKPICCGKTEGGRREECPCRGIFGESGGRSSPADGGCGPRSKTDYSDSKKNEAQRSGRSAETRRKGLRRKDFAAAIDKRKHRDQTAGRSTVKESTTQRSVYISIACDLAIAAIKFIACALTGSSAMLSEGIHSVVDSSNGALLLWGRRASRRRADDDHPFGYGKELYFWALIVAVLIFAIGGGMSIYEGISQ
jgi:hypothetical protein